MILITGATDGLGRYVVGELLKSGERVIAHGRNEARLAELSELGAETLRADLSELRQVDKLADEILARYDRLDVLVNNAGIGTGSDFSRREESPDGVELRFAVNYLAGYHLTRRLLPLLRASAPAKVVNVASAGQAAIDFADPMLTRSYEGMRAYGQSKLAQIMFTVDLAEELAGSDVTVNALHPATMMPTTMVRESGIGTMSTLEEGGAAVLYLIHATDGVTGAYYNGTHRATPNAQAADPQARQQLRSLTEELVTKALN